MAERLAKLFAGITWIAVAGVAAALLYARSVLAVPMRIMWAVGESGTAPPPSPSGLAGVLFVLASLALAANAPLVAVRVIARRAGDDRNDGVVVPAAWSVGAATLLAGVGTVLS